MPGHRIWQTCIFLAGIPQGKGVFSMPAQRCTMFTGAGHCTGFLAALKGHPHKHDKIAAPKTRFILPLKSAQNESQTIGRCDYVLFRCPCKSSTKASETCPFLRRPRYAVCAGTWKTSSHLVQYRQKEDDKLYKMSKIAEPIDKTKGWIYSKCTM